MRFEYAGEKLLGLNISVVKKWIPASSTHSTKLPAPNDDRSLSFDCAQDRFGTGQAGQSLLRIGFAGMRSHTFKLDAIIVAIT